MSPAAGMVLLKQIVPLIARAVARGAVKPVGGEDQEELTAEGQALAAVMVDRLEAKGKVVAPSNIAYYALQALKSGRRSGYTGRMDAMCPAAMLDRAVQVDSMDAVVGADEDDSGHEMTLHDHLSSNGEDVDAAAARRLDWGEVMSRLDDRRQAILTAMVEGYGTNAIADQMKVSPPRVCQLKESLGQYVIDAWGGNGIRDVTKPATWRSGLRAVAERHSGRYMRAHRGKSR